MGSMKIPLKDLEQTAFLVESLYRTRQETIKVCHILLQNPRFFQLLLQIDIDLAAQTRAVKCQCGGTLHKADYPRKPRGCPSEARADYESRFSFCCSQCRKQKLQGQVYQCSILLPHPSPASPNNSPHSGEMHAEVVCDLLVRITSQHPAGSGLSM